MDYYNKALTMLNVIFMDFAKRHVWLEHAIAKQAYDVLLLTEVRCIKTAGQHK